MSTKYKFNHYYYHECKNCGFRIDATVDPEYIPPSGNDIFIAGKQGQCLKCKTWNMLWDVVCITKKEKILPKM